MTEPVVAAAGSGSEAPPPPSLAAQAAGSGVWTLAGQAFQVILGLVSFGVLSRWLTPADYGVLGMAATVSGIVGVIGDSGVGSAVTRLPRIDDEAEATAFWLSLMGGAILTAITAIAAPILAWFYKDDGITSVSLALAAMFFLAAPMRVSGAKLSRQLRFRQLTLISIASSIGSVGVVLVLAARGFGVWALVAQTASAFALQTVLTVAASPPTIRPRFWSRARAREIAKMGSHLSGFSLAIMIGRALDTVLAGRFLGPGALGLMGMGTKLAYVPVERLNGAMSSVFLPATVELGDDERQARAFKSTLRLMLIVVAPFGVGIAAIAPEVVALLPPRWAGLVPVLRLYALTTLITPMGYLSMSVLVAHGRGRDLLRVSIWLIPLCWAGAIAGAVSGSVLGMVGAWSFSIAAGGFALLALSWRRLSLTRNFWTIMATPIAVSVLMAVVVRLALSLTGLGHSRAGFILGAVVGAVVYALLAWVTMRSDLTRAARLLGESIRRRRGRAAA